MQPNTRIMIQKYTFLEEGPYTTITEYIKKSAKEEKSGKDKLWAIEKHLLFHLTPDPTNKPTLFRKRTAHQILMSGVSTGCTDWGLAFIALARASHIPARYVETFDEAWLQDAEAETIRGHVFIDVFVEGAWKVYDPGKGLYDKNRYVRKDRPHVVAGKGLDFGHIYLREKGLYRSEPTSLQSLNEALALFKPNSIGKAYY